MTDTPGLGKIPNKRYREDDARIIRYEPLTSFYSPLGEQLPYSTSQWGDSWINP